MVKLQQADREIKVTCTDVVDLPQPGCCGGTVSPSVRVILGNTKKNTDVTVGGGCSCSIVEEQFVLPYGNQNSLRFEIYRDTKQKNKIAEGEFVLVNPKTGEQMDLRPDIYNEEIPLFKSIYKKQQKAGSLFVRFHFVGLASEFVRDEADKAKDVGHGHEKDMMRAEHKNDLLQKDLDYAQKPDSSPQSVVAPQQIVINNNVGGAYGPPGGGKKWQWCSSRAQGTFTDFSDEHHAEIDRAYHKSIEGGNGICKIMINGKEFTINTKTFEQTGPTGAPRPIKGPY